MPGARSQEVLQKSCYAQATIEWTWSGGEFLLLLARCTSVLGFRCAFESPVKSRN